MVIIYNGFDEKDCWVQAPELWGTSFIINNFTPSKELARKLNDICTLYYCIKLYQQDWESELYLAKKLGIKNIALDAENYKKDLKYSYALGDRILSAYTKIGFDDLILLPEKLSDEKYEHYEDFVKGLKPTKILLERTYNECFKLPYYYLRNKKELDFNAEYFAGIWPEKIWPILRPIQLCLAKTASNGRIFWYSESKALPIQRMI